MDHAQEDAEARESLEALVARVREGAPPGIAHDVLGRAIANALLIEGQLLLERTSTDDDVELFFETFSREQRDTTQWAGAILTGISGRLDDASMDEFCHRAAQRAVGFVQQESALAFGNYRKS